MQLTAIQTKARFLTNTTSTDFTDANLNRALNDWYHQLFAVIMKTMGDWEINGDYATTNLVANQDEYVLAADYLTLKRVEVNPTGSTNGWELAEMIDMKEQKYAISNSDTLLSRTRVETFDNSLFLRPTPTANVTNGLKIWFSKEFTELSGGTDEPVTPEFTHIYLVHGAGLDWATARGMDNKVRLFNSLLQNDVEQIKSYFSRRLAARPVKLERTKKSYK